MRSSVVKRLVVKPSQKTFGVTTSGPQRSTRPLDARAHLANATQPALIHPFYMIADFNFGLDSAEWLFYSGHDCLFLGRPGGRLVNLNLSRSSWVKTSEFPTNWPTRWFSLMWYLIAARDRPRYSAAFFVLYNFNSESLCKTQKAPGLAWGFLLWAGKMLFAGDFKQFPVPRFAIRVLALKVNSGQFDNPFVGKRLVADNRSYLLAIIFYYVHF